MEEDSSSIYSESVSNVEDIELQEEVFVFDE